MAYIYIALVYKSLQKYTKLSGLFCLDGGERHLEQENGAKKKQNKTKQKKNTNKQTNTKAKTKKQVEMTGALEDNTVWYVVLATLENCGKNGSCLIVVSFINQGSRG